MTLSFDTISQNPSSAERLYHTHKKTHHGEYECWRETYGLDKRLISLRATTECGIIGNRGTSDITLRDDIHETHYKGGSRHDTNEDVLPAGSVRPSHRSVFL